MGQLLLPQLAILCLAALCWPLEGRWVASTEKYPKHLENMHKRTSLIERFGMTGLERNTSTAGIQPIGGTPFLENWVMLLQPEGEYYGAKATFSVYGLPEVGPSQVSEVALWVDNGVSGSPENFNAIKAGWHVYPEVYGDHDTYFFVAWTVDAQFKTGCYNLACKGFVLDKSSKYVPGTIIRPLSVYNGEQHYITLKISRNPETGDWWLHAGPNADQPVGYWPNSLFTSLSRNASAVQWGGDAYYHKDEKSPPMGSGHFPNEGEGKAASLTNIKLISSTSEFYDPNPFVDQDKTDCYQIGGDKVLYFGGPGC